MCNLNVKTIFKPRIKMTISESSDPCIFHIVGSVKGCCKPIRWGRFSTTLTAAPGTVGNVSVTACTTLKCRTVST